MKRNSRIKNRSAMTKVAIMALVAMTVGMAGASTVNADPPAPSIVWENDMSTDPISGVAPNWVVRGGGSGYTVSGGLLTMNAAAWSTVLDTMPTDQFLGITTVDMEWKSTTAGPAGAGLWLNVDNESTTYAGLRFESYLVEGSQTFDIRDNSGVIATVPGLGTGMLTLHAVVDTTADSINYSINGTTGSVNYTEVTMVKQLEGATLYTAGAGGAVVDYIRIEANARPAEGEGYLVAPDAIAMTLLSPATLATGSVDVIYGSATNLEITAITVSDESHGVGSFSVLTTAPQTLANASAETVALEVEFDNTVANLPYGSATGLVTIAWTEEGSGVTNETVVPVSAAITFPADQVNTWNGLGNGVNWGDADNWSLARVPGAYAADRALIDSGATVAVASDVSGAYVVEVSVSGSSTLNVGADLKTLGKLTVETGSVVDIDGGDIILEYSNIEGGGLIKLQSGSFYAGDNTGGGMSVLVDMEISGGALTLLNQMKFGNAANPAELKVIGDAASITVKHLQFQAAHAVNGTLRYELDADGVSPIVVTSWMYLDTATVVVDGSLYTGGTTNIVLVDGLASLNGVATNTLSVTNFGAGYTAQVVNDAVNFDLVLEIVQSAGPDPIGDITLGGLVAGDLVFSWNTSVGQSYSVQTNADLTIPSGWGIQDTIVGDGNPVSVTNTPVAAQLFYKVTSP